MVRSHQPLIFVHENVCGFPEDFLTSQLGDLYSIDQAVLEPQLFSLPVSRKRRYAVCRLKSTLRIPDRDSVRFLAFSGP